MAEVGQFRNLFQPISIGPMQLKNRTVMLPMFLAMDFGTDQARAFLVRRARGGMAAIVHGAIPVDAFLFDECWGESGRVEALTTALCRLTQDVQQAGAKIGVQLLQLNCYPWTATFASDYAPTSIGSLPEIEWVAPSERVEPTPFIHTLHYTVVSPAKMHTMCSSSLGIGRVFMD